jgi:hypothetical protein
MSKKIQISIPAPCHENWDEMTPVEKGHYCDSCKKTVVDFSDMTDRQIAEFFKKPSSGSLCGRFMDDQLDRPIDIPKKRIPWFKYFFQIALPALVFSHKVNSQNVRSEIKANTSARKTSIGDTIVLPEVVAVSKVPNTNCASIGMLTLLPAKIAGPVVERSIESIDTFTKDLPKPHEVNLSNGLSGRTGGLIITFVEPKSITNNAKDMILDGESSGEKGSASISAFPNPISGSSVLSIKLKNVEEGLHHLELLNSSGQLIEQKEEMIKAYEKTFQYHIPELINGNYFLVLTNSRTGKKYSEKIIIQ